MRYSDPELVDQLAAAYVLGTLKARSRRRFAGLAAQRADMAIAVAQWEARLGRLAQAVPPMQPSPALWDRIAQRTRPTPAAPTPSPRGWWRLAGFGAGGFAGGAVAAMALLVTAPALLFSTDQLAMRTGEKLPQSYVGLLTDAQGNGKLLVSSLRHGRVVTVKAIGAMEPPAPGRQRVLWAVPTNGAPFVIGAAPTTGSLVSTLPDTSERLLSKVTKLMVTEEATAQPTSPGAAVFLGNCAKLW